MLAGRKIKEKKIALERCMREPSVVNFLLRNTKKAFLLGLLNSRKDVKNMREQSMIVTRIFLTFTRVIYQYAIDQASLNGDLKEIEELKAEFINYEKRHGSREAIEDIILNNRRDHYNTLLKDDRFAYDTWFDLIR
jgi:hypothetical protein